MQDTFSLNKIIIRLFEIVLPYMFSENSTTIRLRSCDNGNGAHIRSSLLYGVLVTLFRVDFYRATTRVVSASV